MKKSLKVISVLLAMLMGFSSLSIGASAAYADYSQPAGYDSLDHPYISINQCGSMLLDFIDKTLAKKDIYGTLDLSILGSLDYDLRSVDKALDTVVSLVSSSLYSNACSLLDMGDLEGLNISAIRSSPRRTTAGRTDLEIVYALTQFLVDNKNKIGRIVDSCWDNGGLVGNYLDINETVGDVHAMISDAIFGFTVESLGYTSGQITNADTMIDYFVGNLLFGEKGFLPGFPEAMANIGLPFTYSYSTDDSGVYHFTTTFSLKNVSVYQFLRACLNAALIDFVKPMLLDVFNDLDDSVKSFVYPLLEIDTSLSTEEVVNGLIDLQHGYLTKYIILDETGFYLTDDFYSLLTNLLQVARGLMPSLSLYPNVETKNEEEIAAITDEGELVAYLVRTVLVGLIDFADIPANVTTIREVATYLMINYMSDKMPEVDYYAKIASGEINPKTDGALEVLADFAYYYLNATTTMSIPEGKNFTQTLEWIFNWVLRQFGGLFKTDNLTSSDVWVNIDTLVWKNILDVTILPDKYSTLPLGSITKTVLFDDLIYAILDWDLESVVAIFRSNSSPTACMSQSVNTFVITLVKRILNGVFQGNPANESTLVMNSSITCINDLIVDKSNTSDSNKTNLRVMAEKLIERLVTYDSNILNAALPLFAKSLANVDDSAYDVYAPDGTYFSDIDLESMLLRQMPGDEQAVNYDDSNYVFIDSEDFRPMYKYYNYDDVRKEAETLLRRYREGTILNPVTDADITNIAYRLDYYYNKLSLRDADVTQLRRELTKANAAYGHAAWGEDESSIRYSPLTWNNYLKVYNFAQSVYVEYLGNYDGTLRQSKISYARRLIVQAQKMLKAYSGLADYDKLDQFIIRAEAIITQQYADPAEPYYTQETFDNMMYYYNIAKAIPRDYDSDGQSIINEAADALEYAIDEDDNPLQIYPLPNLIKVASQVVFENVNKYIWGFKEGLVNTSGFASYVKVIGAGYADIIKTKNGYGTGTVIQLVSDAQVIKQYTVIVFGDVDGNSKADGTDANLVYALNADLIEQSDLTTEQQYACDANNDGRIDVTDYQLLVQAGLLKTSVSQRGAA